MTGPLTASALRQEGPQQELIARVQDYLSNGGFFNPELMDQWKTRELIIDLTKALSASRTAQAPQQEEWRILRERKWDWHDQHLIVRPFVDQLIVELAAAQARIQVLETSVDYLRNLIDHPVKQQAAFTENEIKDVLCSLYQDGHVDLVLADRVAALMNQSALPSSPAEGENKEK